MMADIGVVVPPAGVVPDFKGQSSLQRSLIILVSITFALATLFLLIRLYTSAVILKELVLDDVLIVLAWGCSLAFTVGQLVTMKSGYGKHLWDVRESQIQGYMNMLGFIALTYIWTPSITKLAMLAFYRRINPFLSFHIGLYAIAILILLYSFVFTYYFCGPCNPLGVGSGTCLNNVAIAHAVVNIATDVVIVAFPIPMIHRLRMPFEQKLLVGLILGVGSAATIASIIRVATVKAMAQNADFTYAQGLTTVWSIVEMNFGLVCNCMTRLKPFIRHHFPQIAFSLGGNNNPGGLGPYIKQETSNNKPQVWRADHTDNGYHLEAYENQAPGALLEGVRSKSDRRGRGIYIKNGSEVRYNDSLPTPKEGSTDNILHVT